MRRIPELDALRGVAALVIVAAHIGWLGDSRWAVSAVDLFFVLSGYLITAQMLRNREAPGFLATFAARRALRIWPAYYAALFACLWLNRGLKWDAPPDAWPYYFTFTQNVPAYLNRPLPRFSGMFIHTWTLAIEEQFYLLWPLLLWKTGRKATLAVTLAFVALPPAGRAAGYLPYLLLTRCDGLALGSLLAWLLADPARASRNAGAYASALAAVGLAALVGPEVFGPRDGLGPALFTTRAALVYFGLAGVCLVCQGHRALAPLRDRRLCYLGTVSYALYLYHPLVFAVGPGLYGKWAVRKLGLPGHALGKNLAMLAACFLLAEASRRWLEAPMLRLKGRLAYRRPAPAYRGPHRAVERFPHEGSEPVGPALPDESASAGATGPTKLRRAPSERDSP